MNMMMSVNVKDKADQTPLKPFIVVNLNFILLWDSLFPFPLRLNSFLFTSFYLLALHLDWFCLSTKRDVFVRECEKKRQREREREREWERENERVNIYFYVYFMVSCYIKLDTHCCLYFVDQKQQTVREKINLMMMKNKNRNR